MEESKYYWDFRTAFFNQKMDIEVVSTAVDLISFI